jgi:hypothetical protein
MVIVELKEDKTITADGFSKGKMYRKGSQVRVSNVMARAWVRNNTASYYDTTPPKTDNHDLSVSEEDLRQASAENHEDDNKKKKSGKNFNTK